MLKKLFNKQKHFRNKEKTFKVQVLVSILGITLSLSFLSVTTWAWFTDVLTVGNLKIQAANYDISVSIKDKESDMEPIILANDIMKYTLEPNKNYTITLTANGTATTGFCKVTVEGQDYYTEAISTKEGNNKLTFTIKSITGGEVSFASNWGTHSENVSIKDNSEIQIGESTDSNEVIDIDKPVEDNGGNISLPSEPSKIEEDTKFDNPEEGIITPGDEDIKSEEEVITPENNEGLETEKPNTTTENNEAENNTIEAQNN